MIYDPLTEQESEVTNGVMLNGHTDFNTVSILVSQPVAALQVLMPDDVWRFLARLLQGLDGVPARRYELIETAGDHVGGQVLGEEKKMN